MDVLEKQSTVGSLKGQLPEVNLLITVCPAFLCLVCLNRTAFNNQVLHKNIPTLFPSEEKIKNKKMKKWKFLALWKKRSLYQSTCEACFTEKVRGGGLKLEQWQKIGHLTNSQFWPPFALRFTFDWFAISQNTMAVLITPVGHSSKLLRAVIQRVNVPILGIAVLTSSCCMTISWFERTKYSTRVRPSEPGH